MKLYLTGILFIFLVSFKPQKTKNKIITIDPHLSFQNYEHFKRLTLSSPDSHIEYLNGFDFKWGYSYKIGVTETKLDEAYSDGTQYEYKLNRIVSETKMPDSSQFTLFLDSDKYYYELDSSEQHMNATFKEINDSTYLYFEKVEIEVPNKLKSQFKEIVSGEKTRIGHFTYVNEKRIRLVRF